MTVKMSQCLNFFFILRLLSVKILLYIVTVFSYYIKLIILKFKNLSEY